MLKKLLGVLALSSLLFSGAYADDILAIVSKGQLTSNSAGVKELSLEEKMQVKGGYYESIYECGTNQCYALANHASSYLTTMTEREKNEWRALTNGDFYQFVGFLVQNNRAFSKILGKYYNYFTYDAIVYDLRTGHMYKQSKLALNNNLIVRQLSIKHKDQFDRALGGLRIGY